MARFGTPFSVKKVILPDFESIWYILLRAPLDGSVTQGAHGQDGDRHGAQAEDRQEAPGAAAARPLVERFDIEPYSNFSAK